MGDNTTHLNLPFIAASQSQKHITHNEALQKLDAIVHLSVEERDLSSAPVSPAEGTRYIVGFSPSGEWIGKENQVAAFLNGAWVYLLPNEGWLAWVCDEDKLLSYDGTAWGEVSANVNPALLIGVNTSADATNKLSVKSDAVLFSHDDVTPGSGDMRLKFNKDTAGDTASLLYQTGYSGRAELGLAGDDNFHFKVSADGSSWFEAFNINAASGGVTFGSSGASAPMNSYGPLLLEDPSGSNPYARFNDGSNVAYVELAVGEFRHNAKGTNMDFVMYAGNNERLRCTANAGGANGETQFNGAAVPKSDNSFDLGSATKKWDDVWATNATIQTSDRRNKDNIKSLSLGLDFVMALRPVQFKWKDHDRAAKTKSVTSFRPVTEQVERITTSEVFQDGRYVQIETTQMVEKPLYSHQNIYDKNGREIGKKYLPVMEECRDIIVISPSSTRTHTRTHFGLIAQEVEQLLKKKNISSKDFAALVKDDSGAMGLRYTQLIPVLLKAVQDLAKRLPQGHKS